MASRFTSESEEFFKTNEEGTPLNTKKSIKFGVSLFDGNFLFVLIVSLFLYFWWLV